MQVQWLLLVCALVALSLTHALQADADPLVVKTSLGSVQGKYLSVSGGGRARVWASIPYAADTSGQNRFRRPQPRSAWSDTRDSTRWSTPVTACYQPANPLLYSLTEDCLVVNVAAPEVSSSSLFPVMVWFHGGSLRNGAGGIYDGSVLAVEQSVVVVTVNYRLGYFGYIALDELKQEQDGLLGNYGFWDQHFALQWVQQNAAAFGGDPNSVTIFGESAGGTSVGSHLTSPLSLSSPSPLFHRAIIESGQSSFAWTADEARLVSHHHLQELTTVAGITCATNSTGAALTACLRRVGPSTFVNTPTASALNFAHTIDGDVIIDVASNMIAAGKWVSVPLLQGTNHDEMTLFLCQKFASNYSKITRDDAIFYMLNHTLNNVTLLNAALDYYPPSEYGSQWQSVVNFETDGVFRCPAKSNVEGAATHFNDADSMMLSNNSSVYMYSFEYVPGFTTECMQVEHSIEIPFLFPSTLIGYKVFYQMTADEQALSKQMRAAWATFARTGKFVLNSNVSMPSYCGTGSSKSCEENYVRLISPASGLFQIQQSFRDHECDFFRENADAVRRAQIIEPFVFDN